MIRAAPPNNVKRMKIMPQSASKTEKTPPQPGLKKAIGKYIEAVGRRKTATARVRLYPEAKEDDFLVGDKSLEEYFAIPQLVQTARDPFNKLNLEGFKVTVRVSGGGLHGQAEAIRLGLARALVKYNPQWRPQLKALGYLTRDARMPERKKPGLKKARRAPQWQKR